jgi:hypothetical protein
VRDGLLHQGDLIGLLGHISLHQQRFDRLVGSFQGLTTGGLGSIAVAAIIDHYVAALFSQANGDRLANARGSPGDEGGFASQSFHGEVGG